MSRKNAKDFLSDEKQRFCNALLTLKQTIESGHTLNKYDEFVAVHYGVTRRLHNGIHLQKLFLAYSDYDITTPRHVLDDSLTVPFPVRQFLTNTIQVRNQTTDEILSRYKIIGSVPDKFAASTDTLDQILTTIGYEDRVGRTESDNDFVDVILEINHTNSQVNSVRGIQLGGDDIEVLVNDTSTGTLIKTQEIPLP